MPPVSFVKSKPKAAKPVIQTKLTINTVSDQYEEEADAMADKVMRRPADATSTPVTGIIGNSLQRKKSSGEEAKTKPVMRKVQPTGCGSESSTSLLSSLNASKGGGSPLPSSTRQFMENAFSTDFSHVRLHTGSNASGMNKNIGARAFTHGSDIYFDNGEYLPGSYEGEKLLAHELTHVMQQSSAPADTFVQRKPKAKDKKDEKKAIADATQDDLVTFLKEFPLKDGYFERTTKGLEVYMVDFNAKEYLVQSDIAWLKNKPVRLPNTERKTNQMEVWKGEVKEEVMKQYQTLAGSKDLNKLFMLSLTGKGKKKAKNKSKVQKGIAGNLNQLAEETSVPFWNILGNDNLYDVEHMVDWQIAGTLADNEKNLILLDRKYNRSLGNKVREMIHTHINKITKHYARGFTGVGGDAKTNLQRFNVKGNAVYIKTFKPGGKGLDDDQWYFRDEMVKSSAKGNPFKQELINVKSYEIPENHFVLRTTDDRAGYFLPYQAKNEIIGAWQVTCDFDSNSKELKSINFQIVFRDEGGAIVEGKRKIKGKVSQDKDSDTAEIKPVKKENHIYEVQSEVLRRRFGRVFKELYGDVRKLSPIELGEPNVSGFDVNATGKVKPSLSILNGVDVDFGIDNGDFFVQATIPLEQIAKNFPRPFTVSDCSLVITANSGQGLSVAGLLGFKLGNFGTGEIVAGINDNGVYFDGTFNFNSKWFNPATVTIGYKDGAWSIEGTVGVEDGRIPGVKAATLTIGYIDGKFKASGSAELKVPGLSKLGLEAEVDKNGNFAVAVETTLSEIPGIKGGRVKVTIKSVEGSDDIQLRVEGKAIPNLPNVPNIQPEINFLYDNGIFDINTEVAYNKGRFSGKIQVGVTNRSVDETGRVSGDGANAENNPIIVYGYGELTAVLFKDNKGTVKVRLTPEGNVMVGGLILLHDLSPFGDGYNFERPIIKFPTITIPLFGIPGMSISAFIDGGVFFAFNWDPLRLKELRLDLHETNIEELDKVQLDITGSIGSMAKAEVYMTINAGLKARVLIATLTGKIGGRAGLGITAEAGGALSASWSPEKGLQFKEVRAFLNVTPQAVFKLTGSISVDLDIWIATLNLYYHEWTFAEKSIDLSGLTLKLDFPIQFDENNNLIMPEFSKMNLEKPDFDGDAGEKVLDEALNSDARKEEEEKKRKIKADIERDLREGSKKEDFSPSKYTEKMRKKYAKSKEMQEFVLQTIEDVSRAIEYENFELRKNLIRGMNQPLETKLSMLRLFTMYNWYVTDVDIEAFRNELIKTEELKVLIAEQLRQLEELNKKIAAEEEERRKNPPPPEDTKQRKPDTNKPRKRKPKTVKEE